MVLPKLWIGAIQKYWENKVPSGYPNTTSEFSLKFDTIEQKQAVDLMENSLNTENSIITDDMIVEGEKVNSYLGTYEVKGIPNELTLISPIKVSNNTTRVIAFHLNETLTWEKIEDTQIIDSYVYGTLNSFSPIAVFTISKDTLFVESHPDFANGPTFIANGIAIKVFSNDNDEIVVIDGNNKETIIPEKTTIIGGTIDGTDVDSVSVYISNIRKPLSVNAGSYGEFNGNISKIKKCSLIINNCGDIDSSGAGINCRIDDMSITINNSKLKFLGCGESFSARHKKDCNGIDLNSVNLGSNSWVKNCNYDIDNSSINLLFMSGNSGLFYVTNTHANINNSDIGYIITGGSNGITDYAEVLIENSKIGVFQTTNRGIVHESKASIKNCETECLFVAGDSNDSTVTGIIDKVSIDVTGGIVTLYRGTYKGKKLEVKDAKSIVNCLKISRNTDLKYGEPEDLKILKDIIILK